MGVSVVVGTRWLDALKEHLAEEENTHNAAVAFTQEDASRDSGSEFSQKSVDSQTNKTYKTSNDADTPIAGIIQFPEEVFEQARRRFPNRDSLPAPLMPGELGRDPLVHANTEKAQFFLGCWRSAPPKNWRRTLKRTETRRGEERHDRT